MAIGNIIFNKGQGGLGRPLPGQDFISGLLFYVPQTTWVTDTSYVVGAIVTWTDGNLYQCAIANDDADFTPSKWNLLPAPGAAANLLSLNDAQTNGILPAYNKNNLYADSNYADATPATGTVVISSVGATGDVWIIVSKVLNIGGTVSLITLASYTQQSGDSTPTLLAASIKAAINANTNTTGFSASAATGTITITAPRSQGTALNGSNTTAGQILIGETPIACSTNGDGAFGTITQFSGGTQSLQAIWYYHISEFFRMQPQGSLYIGFNPTGTYTFTEITAIQSFANGTIRQVGIYLDGNSHAFNSGNLTADLGYINNEIVSNNDNQHKPLSALYSSNMAALTTANLNTLLNLGTLSNEKTSVVISQDGAAFGNFLFLTSGYTIGNIGALLGTVALSSVSDDIMWVGKFNVSNGTECDTPAFGNGTLVKSVSQNLLTTLDNNRYIFLLKYIGNAGTFWNEGNTAISESSDYAYIENNRVIDKADRGIYSSLLPALGSPLIVNADGTLTNETIAYLTGLAKVNLDQMVRDQELSAYAVVINPAQNVLSTSTLTITVQLVPVGVARTIEVNIGYTVSITT